MTDINKEEIDDSPDSVIDSVLGDIEHETKMKRLENAKDNIEFQKELYETNYKNSKSSFMERYIPWRANKEMNIDHLSYKSRVNTYLCNIFYGTPESLNVPFYYWYELTDKGRCSTFHMQDNNEFAEYKLHVNKHTIEFRKKAAKTCAIIILLYGLFMASVGIPLVNGVSYGGKYVNAKVFSYVGYQYDMYFDLKKVENMLEVKNQEVDKLAKDRKSEIKIDAKALKEKYESGSIQTEEFNAQANVLKEKDKKIDEAIISSKEKIHKLYESEKEATIQRIKNELEAKKASVN